MPDQVMKENRKLLLGHRGISWEQVASALAGLAAWEVAGRLFHYPFLPPFSSAFGAAWEIIADGQIAAPLAASFASLAVGYGLAALAGLAVGLLTAGSAVWDGLLSAYIDGLLAAPGLIFVPILFSLFGVGRTSQTALVFLYSFAVIAANTRTGVRAAEKSLLEMARCFGANSWQLFFRVILPGALPVIMTGLRIGLTRGIKGMINGEMLIAFIGLGALIKAYGSRFDAARLWGLLMIITAISMLFAGTLQALERRLARRYSVGPSPVES